MEMSYILENPTKSTGKVYLYPDGSMDIVASSSAIFSDKSSTASSGRKRSKNDNNDAAEKKQRDGKAEDLERAKRRARAMVRRIALASGFDYFVTLTFDPKRVDSLDPAAVVRAMSTWCDNNVRRRGLKYILVPELHKSGRVHFHGFFNDALPREDSGTIKMPGEKKPRKPRTKKQRAEMLAAGGQVVWNLPNWTYGFTTALELHGPYPAAVAYVCKYIGKDHVKIAGRWYYSGGDVQKPVEKLCSIEQTELRDFDGHWEKLIPGSIVCGINGVRPETFSADEHGLISLEP